VRDIDQIIERLKIENSAIRIEQLKVKFPADDDGLWFVTTPAATERVQIEASTGNCPFVIESDCTSEQFEARTIDEVVSTVIRLLRECR
jgi:hypothetical protein